MGFTAEEWEEVSQELPKKDDDFLLKYIQGREALIGQENQQRSDYHFKQSLSPIAKKACAIVERIRNDEAKSVWTPQLEDTLAQTGESPLFPGMMFSLSKERMEQTKLWNIVRRMPKGCLLHAHLDAMVDFDYLIDYLLSLPGIHLASDRSLHSAENRLEATLEFRYFKLDKTDANVWSESYAANAHTLLTAAADAFPDGGRVAFKKWLYSRCTLSRNDALESHHGVDAIWKSFYKCFRVVGTMLHYEPMFRAFLRRLMTLLKADGLSWAEVRFTWPLNYYRDQSEVPESDYNAMMTVIDEEVEKFKSSEEGKGFWGIRTIWTTIRILPTRTIAEDMDNCITTKMQFPHLIAGYDLVGQEDAGRPLKDILPELFWFRKQCAQEDVNLPFFFHAGECLGSGSDTDHNLFDAILLGTRRIGHGFSLYKHPLLIDLVKEKKILIESCPISNEVLRLCGSVMSHPLPALLARGVPCALCNDDPAMLGQDTAGSTHDFWQALQGWENLGLAGLGSLAENSIRWAAFEDQTQEEWVKDIKEASLGSGTKAKRLQEWQIEWEKYCLWIVTEFGKEGE